MARARELSAAYRAVYLASPLKFCTTLHAFTRVVPRYYINPWEKDPYKWQHHKYRRSRERKRGKFGAWAYLHDLPGRESPWPEPGLLGVRGLVDVAQKAQAERFEDFHFWEKVAERAVVLRDVMDVGDLAVILDTLLTANHRHTHLLKTLSRELIDDVDKLSLVEAAVILNSYAQFNCESTLMLKAFAGHVVRLLSGQPYTTVDSEDRYGSQAADPQTLAVLCKAFASLRYKDPFVTKAVNVALVDRVDDASFASVAEVLEAFCELQETFEAPVEFWVALGGKVPGTPIRFLSPALRALQLLKVNEPALCEALGNELVARMEDARQNLVEEPEVLSGSKFPAFPAPAMPMALLEAHVAKDAAPVEEEAQATDDLFQVEVLPSGDVSDEEKDDVGKKKKRRWYNAVLRKVDAFAGDAPKVPSYASFDPDASYKRNLRGFRVAQALEGLEALRGVSTSSSSEGDSPSQSLDVELLQTAKPLVTTALQGLAPSQLALASELFAEGKDVETVRLILHEALRRMSNFSVDEIRRLNAACQSCGLEDPYLWRARKRRFPKALRKELRVAE